MNRKVAWFFAGKDSAGIDASQVVGVGNTAAVADQSSGRCELTPQKDAWYGVPHRDCGQRGAFAEEKRVAAGDHQPDGPLRQPRGDIVEFRLRARLQDLQLQSKRARRFLRIMGL